MSGAAPSPAPARATGDNPRFVVHPDTDPPFDYTAARRIAKPTNVVESMAHMVKGCLGGGIMGIHVAYSKCGLWVAVVGTIFFGIFITYCVHIIVETAQRMYQRLHITEMSYPDVAEACFQCSPFPRLRKCSKVFRYAVDAIICIDLFGSCAVYEIIIARTIAQLISYVNNIPIITPDGNPIAENVNDVRFYTGIILLPILLICMIRSLKYLAPFSIVANCFIVLTIFATIYYCFQSPIRAPLADMPVFNSISGFCEYAGVVVFSMEGVGVSLPIENNMKHPRKFPLALIGGMVIVVSFVSCVGFFGYWGWGNGCKSPVTLNLPDSVFPTIIKALMALMIYVTFALNFWAPFNLVWFYISQRYPPEKHWIWERVHRTIIIIIITIVAIVFPQITALMGLLGGFCLSNMGFIFPAILETVVIWEKPGLGPGKIMLWKNILILLMGAALGTASTSFNAIALFSGNE